MTWASSATCRACWTWARRNDAYAAVQVALALADALKCDVNDLPLSLVLSWYEQKAVSILLTLLALGIKNICLDPACPPLFHRPF